MELSPYIEGQVKESLKYHEKIDGFIITNKNMDVPTMWACPWVGHHHNAALPNVALNIHRLSEGWCNELKQFKEIQALYILSDIIDLDFVKNFKNLKELFIIENNCKDWNFLRELTELDTLYVRMAPYFDTIPIKGLLEKQVSRMEQYRKAIKKGGPYLPIPRVLNEMSLTYCNLTDKRLTDLAVNQNITELNLSHNAIKSIDSLKDVSVYYLTLRYNQLTDIEALQYVPYYLNVRHNQIKQLPDLSKMKHCRLSRLFVEHNDLPETELKKIRKMKLLKTDLY